MIDSWEIAGMFLERTGIEVRLFLFFSSLSLYFFKKKKVVVITVLPKLLHWIQIDTELGVNGFLVIIWLNFESFISS